MTGGILGLIGVAISLLFSWRLSKNNKDFQKEMNKDNQKFQEELSKKENEHKIWMKKYEVLVQLIGYRYDIGTKEFQYALNSVPAVFSDSKEVIRSVKSFYTYTSHPSKSGAISNEKLIAVFVEMYKDLGIEENVDEAFLEKIFNVG